MKQNPPIDILVQTRMFIRLKWKGRSIFAVSRNPCIWSCAHRFHNVMNNRLTLLKLGQWHGCWCPGDERSQVINIHGIAYVQLTNHCLPFDQISISRYHNSWQHMKCGQHATWIDLCPHESEFHQLMPFQCWLTDVGQNSWWHMICAQHTAYKTRREGKSHSLGNRPQSSQELGGVPTCLAAWWNTWDTSHSQVSVMAVDGLMNIWKLATIILAKASLYGCDPFRRSDPILKHRSTINTTWSARTRPLSVRSC